MEKFSIKTIIKYIKELLLSFISFIISLFSKDENSSTTTKKIDELKKTKKKTLKEGASTSNKDEDNIHTISSTKKSYIDFDKEFKKVIEQITGLEIKYATKSQTDEIEKVKINVQEKITTREEMSYFTSKEDELRFLEKTTYKEVELRFLEKTTYKEVELNKRLPIVKPLELEKTKNEDLSKQEVTEEVKKDNIEKVIESIEVIVPKEEIEPPQPVNVGIEEEKEMPTPTLVEEDLPTLENESNTQEEDEVIEKDIEEEPTTLTPIVMEEEVENILSIDETISEDLNIINTILENKLASEEEYEEAKVRLAQVSDKLDNFIEATTVDNETKNKLQELKEDIKKEEEQIPQKKKEEEKKEAELLNEKLKKDEIQHINHLMENIYKDNKTDIQDEMITKVEDLNDMSLKEIKKVEKKLLKKRLKKAARAIEPPLLLSLPFIRNKFFWGFTAGLFLHNHLNTIDSLYNRTTIEYNPLDEEKYISGKQAMEDMISLNRNNFQRVESIKEKYLERYPELVEDADFVLSITNMETKLQKQEEKLLKTSTRFDHTKKKQNQIYKKLTLQKKDV